MKKEVSRIKTARAYYKLTTLTHLITGKKDENFLKSTKEHLEGLSESHMYDISLEIEYDQLRQAYNELVKQNILEKSKKSLDIKKVQQMEKKQISFILY